MSMEASLQETPDAKLVAAARAGNRGAYAALIQRHAGRVFAVCLGVLGDFTDSEDIAQETFMRGLINIRSLHDDDRFSVWITQIARNQCRDHLKTRKRRAELLDRRTVQVRPSGTDFSQMYSALDKLTEKHRLPLALYYLDGRDVASVALELGVSEAAAYTRLSRARRALRKTMEEVKSK